MKLLLLSAFLLMISSLAMATPDSSQLGPYVVSFDLNTNIQYQIQTAQPTQNAYATAYQMRIFTDNSTYAIIGVTHYNDLTDATLSMHKSLMQLQMYLSGLNATAIDDTVIDGKAGFAATFVPLSGVQGIPADAKLYSALYWLDAKDCSECGPVSVGQTYVAMTSTYPQDVTQSLLASLHVEEGQAAATGTSADMPPAQN
ncbi:MAG: hypothetical protein GYA29_00780 [Methanothrix sp.]|nr:hypothetical protein [Methanothrix sp.]